MSIEKSSPAIDDEKKKAKNLCNALINDWKDFFYATDKTTKMLVRKVRNLSYKKDTVFVNIYNGLESKTFIRHYIGLVDILKHYRLI